MVAHLPKSDATKPPKREAAPKPAPSASAKVANPPAEPVHSSASGSPARYTYKSPAQPAPGNRSEAEASFAQGLQAYQAHRLPEAIQAYRIAARQDPSLFQAQYNLGMVAAETGDLPLALTSYEHALAINPASLDARYNFALVLKQANYLTDAINELEKVLASAPNETRAHLALGNIYAQQLRQPAKAHPHYLTVLELEPQHPQAAAIRSWLAANPP